MFDYDLQIPVAVSYWIEPLLWVLIALGLLWAVLAVLSYIKRRAYNLSPVETVSGDASKPDFLNIDHAAREKQIKRGEKFVASDVGNDTPQPQYSKALSFARIASIFVAVSTFVSAMFFAFMRIEYVETVWQKYSAMERFSAIVQTYPVGFGFAVFLILIAFVRLLLTLRSST